MQDQLDLLIDGKGTEFEPVILSIRQFLGELEFLKNSNGGAIIFFKKKNDSGELMMQVFPFKKDVAIFNLAEKDLDVVEKVKLFEQINKEKPFRDFWYFNQFKEEFSKSTHIDYRIPDELKLDYKDYDSHQWGEFVDGVLCNSIPKNKYEQILFESGCAKITLFPLPVFSTPSILLAIENTSNVKNNIGPILNALYFRTRDPIAKHLYSK